MKNCNRCGRFKGRSTHTCKPVKIVFGSQVSFMRLERNASSQSSKKYVKRNSRTSRLVAGGLVMWAALAFSFTSWHALAEVTDNTVEYVAATSTPEIVSLKPESIHDKIYRYAAKYGIAHDDLWNLVDCETAHQFDPKMQSSARYTFTDKKYGIIAGERERSYGLAMVHMPVHPEIDHAQMTDPDFALDFIGRNWPDRHQLWVNCTVERHI